MAADLSVIHCTANASNCGNKRGFLEANLHFGLKGQLS